MAVQINSAFIEELNPGFIVFQYGFFVGEYRFQIILLGLEDICIGTQLEIEFLCDKFQALPGQIPGILCRQNPGRGIVDVPESRADSVFQVSAVLLQCQGEYPSVQDGVFIIVPGIAVPRQSEFKPEADGVIIRFSRIGE